jgi:hypothetical protein
MGKRYGMGRTSEMSKNININRHDAIVRARRKLIMLIENNFRNNDKFITLTFKENVSVINIANYEFKKFIERLKYGAIHYHMLASLPIIKKSELAAIWRNGFVKINNIKEVDDLGAYLIKYMTKNKDIWKLAREKSYLCSKNLKRPVFLYDRQAGERLKELGLNIENVVYSGVYEKPDGKGNISLVFDVQLVKKMNKKYRKENKDCGVLDELLAIEF